MDNSGLQSESGEDSKETSKKSMKGELTATAKLTKSGKPNVEHLTIDLSNKRKSMMVPRKEFSPILN